MSEQSDRITVKSWRDRALAGLGIALVFAVLLVIGERNYLLFHSLVELFSIVVGCAIFTVAWNTRRLVDNDYLLFIGVGYLFVAGLDLIHTLAYQGINIIAMTPDPATQIWIQSRVLEAATYCAAIAFLKRRVNTGALFGTYLGLSALGLITIFWWPVFPSCLVVGKGLTPFKQAMELVITGIYCVAIVLTRTNREKFDVPVERLIITSICVAIASELCFMFYLSPTGYINMAGHFLKLVSFMILYEVFVVTGLRHPLNLLFRDLKRSEIDLRRKHDWLEVRVAARTVQLEQRTAQLRKLAADLIQAEQGERRRLSQVLHDGLQQTLVAGRIHLGVAQGRVKGDPNTAKVLTMVEELINEAIDESRSLSAELCPRVLYEEGLGEALVWLGKQMEAKQGIRIDVQIEADARPEDGNISLMLFHSARELIFNIVKHAKVDRARVILARDAANGLRLSIEDDGAGYDPAAVKESTGLFSIRERMTYLGGSMEVQTAPGKGTRVHLHSPLRLASAPPAGTQLGPAPARNQ